MIVAIEYGWEYHHLIGIFIGTVNLAKMKINEQYPQIEWEDTTQDEKDSKPSFVLRGGIRVPDAHGDGTHLDEPLIALYSVAQGFVYPISNGL